MLEKNKIYTGDCLKVLQSWPSEIVQMVVTSPPYWGLRDYKVAGQIGLEASPESFINRLVEVFREARRILKPNGTLWLNLGDSHYNYRPGADAYNAQSLSQKNRRDMPEQCAKRGQKIQGLKEKDLVGIPWRVALALQADGWYLRSDIIWHKPNPMPESVKDRPTRCHEYLFLLSKSPNYYYNHEAIREPAVCTKICGPNMTDTRLTYGIGGGNGGLLTLRRKAIENRKNGIPPSTTRNNRDVWTIPTKAFKGAHFATFPTKLIEPCILAGSRSEDVVLDPFMGSGTTAVVAKALKRQYLGIELNPQYTKIAEERISTAVHA